MTTTEPYVDARALAAAMGVSLATVTRWTRAGVPSETWGMRVRRYRVSEVQAWAREQTATLTASNPPQGAANAHRHEPRRG